MTTGPSAKRLTSIEPVTGWRVWRLHFDDGGFVLRSIIREDAWPAGEPMRARCSKHRGFAVPSVHCASVSMRPTPRESLARSSACSQRTSVVGAVAVWGTVIEHETGTRSRFAYPARLRLVVPCLASGLGAVEPLDCGNQWAHTGSRTSSAEPVHGNAAGPRRVRRPRSSPRTPRRLHGRPAAAGRLPDRSRARRACLTAERPPGPTSAPRWSAVSSLVFMGIGLVINAIGVLMIVGWVVSMILIAGACSLRLFSR